MTPYSEIWAEIKKPGTMMSTHTFIGDDHHGLGDFNIGLSDQTKI